MLPVGAIPGQLHGHLGTQGVPDIQLVEAGDSPVAPSEGIVADTGVGGGQANEKDIRSGANVGP